MNYEESVKIHQLLQERNKFLITCHLSPDLDSICSALSLAWYLQTINKEVKIICSDAIPSKYTFIPEVNRIEQIDPNALDFKAFDCIIVPDTDGWKRAGFETEPELKTVVIDHHETNHIDADVSLVNAGSSSTCEIIVQMFADFGVGLDTEVANYLLTGLLSDTDVFNFVNNPATTLKIAESLITLGADYRYITFNLLRQNEFENIKFWGEMIQSTHKEEDYGLVWCAIPYEKYIQFNLEGSSTSDFVDKFLITVSGTTFCMAMIEKEKDVLNISFRSRLYDFDVAKIAATLGGGGHKNAAGAQVKGLPFEQAVEKVLEAARKGAKDE